MSQVTQMPSGKSVARRGASPVGPGANPEDPDRGDRGAPRSWILTLGALLVLRSALLLAPGMWLWGLNPARFVSPLLAAVGLGAMALAMLPWVGRRVVPAVGALGDLSARAVWAARAAWVACAVGTVAALPDRTHFTGDFMLRELAISNRMNPAEVYPQAFRLDVWLHHTLPLKLVEMGVTTPNGAARRTGMVEAALLAILAVELSRTLRLRGVASCFATAALLFGGGLGSLTGLGMAFSELTVLGAAVAVFGLGMVATGSGLGVSGVALACALLVHRSAILLVPVLAVPLVLAVRSRRVPGWPEAALGIGAPLVALAWVARPLVGTALGFDRSVGYFGWPSSLAESAINVVDLLNVLLLVAPGLVLVFGWRGRSVPAAPAAALWVAFAFPFCLLALAVRHAGQGLFRDWEVFGALAAPLGVLAAAWVGQRLESLRREEAWIGVAALAAVVVPTLLWLASQADPHAGMERARAFAVESPRRQDDVRGRTWAFLTGRYIELDDYRDAVTAGRMAARLMPTRNVLLCLAGSEKNVGENVAALADYRRMLALDRSDPVAWYNIATLAAALGDFAQSDEALRGLGATSAGAQVLPLATAMVERERQRQAARSPGSAAGP